MCDQTIIDVDAVYPTGSVRNPHPLSRIGCAKRAAVWEACGGRCTDCGRTMNPWKNFSVDHVIPRSRGDTNALANLVGCCMNCNQRKADTMPAGMDDQLAA
jgi:5-methylcytosine-specific restriction endonuclease McrA